MKPIYRSIGSYMSRVIASGPLAYYPLNEKSGIVAKNWGSLGTDANGEYVGTDLAAAVGPKGGVAPYFDGANDLVKCNSDAFKAAFDAIGGECTVSCWGKVADASVWTDSTENELLRIASSSPSRASYLRNSASNSLDMRWDGSGVIKATSSTFSLTTDWFNILMRISVSLNKFYLYHNGIRTGAAMIDGAAWDGVNTCLFIASVQSTPLLPWKGNIAHVAIWGRALSETEISLLGQ